MYRFTQFSPADYESTNKNKSFSPFELPIKIKKILSYKFVFSTAL